MTEKPTPSDLSLGSLKKRHIAGVRVTAIIDVFTKAGVRYGLRTLLGHGAGAYIQAAFAVTQAVVVPTDGPNGLAFMLLTQFSGMALGLSISDAILVNVASNALSALLLASQP
ncbi:uncharacterized protein BDW47DRAFT_122848 [Aspergillus candidus]|uniref:Uncharacterized protein n=1 Tax=Aspergillus candidus TaxID=41067 RepID=A0A2I2FKY7_ASPCN|nr:hypothetical protein BDW47DRAFT_122848 [Aspergillus candidus]PLB41289.1 hypothetical protein BDW47DRAFT_122848 [Aspergillus candidus]